jgi:MFS family permease
MLISSRLIRARLATVGLFFIGGVSLAMWVANIPTVEASTGLSHAALGSLLLLLGLGSVIGMQVTGYVIDRAGSRITAVASIVLLVSGVVLPGFAVDAWGIGIALFVLGLGQGAVDVSMNDQAVLVEQRWGKAIMSSFHAFFSIGGAFGAALVAVLQSLQVHLRTSLAIGATLVIVLAVIAIPGLIAAEERDAGATVSIEVGSEGTPARRGTVLVLALLAFLLMLAEGSANDWSALHAVKDLGMNESAGALAYGAFAIAMTVGRLCTDWVVSRLGAQRVIRYGAAIAAAGILLVAAVPSYPAVVIGWLVFGVGLSGTVPQIFTAAGNLGGQKQGTMIARVVGAGYLGFLAGPAVIGWTSEYVGLSVAFLIPLLFCVIAALLASRVPATRFDDLGR